jgi:hypothetical protein
MLRVPALQASTKCSPLQNHPARAGLPDRVPPPLFGASFAFVVNGAVIESDIAEAAALSRFVRDPLSLDARAREFVLSGVGIESSAIASLQALLSGSVISVGRSERLLSLHFGNGPLECHWLGCSKAGIAATLSGPAFERRADLESADISSLSFEALEDLLLSSAVMIESEDSLFRRFLKCSARQSRITSGRSTSRATLGF